MMHEAHIVYRRETDVAWRLEADAGNQIMVGPAVTARSNGDRILPQETEAMLSDLRKSAAGDREALRMLAEMVERLARNQNDVAERLAALDARTSAPKRTGRSGKGRPENAVPATGKKSTP